MAPGPCAKTATQAPVKKKPGLEFQNMLMMLHDLSLSVQRRVAVAYKSEKGGSGLNRRLLSMASFTRLTRDKLGLNTTAFKEIVLNNLVTVGQSEATDEAESAWKQNPDLKKEEARDDKRPCRT
jgi:hypothetical protein